MTKANASAIPSYQLKKVKRAASLTMMIAKESTAINEVIRFLVATNMTKAMAISTRTAP